MFFVPDAKNIKPEQLQSILDCAAALYQRGLGDHGSEDAPVTFGNLSDDDKLSIVDGYLSDTVRGIANSWIGEREIQKQQASIDALKYESTIFEAKG